MGKEVMEDCIHLHACRRIQKIGARLKMNVPRYCTPECEAYLSKNLQADYVKISEAVEFARNGVESISAGYGPYDIYCASDLTGYLLGEIIEDVEDA